MSVTRLTSQLPSKCCVITHDRRTASSWTCPLRSSMGIACCPSTRKCLPRAFTRTEGLGRAETLAEGSAGYGKRIVRSPASVARLDPREEDVGRAVFRLRGGQCEDRGEPLAEPGQPLVLAERVLGGKRPRFAGRWGRRRGSGARTRRGHWRGRTRHRPLGRCPRAVVAQVVPDDADVPCRSTAIAGSNASR